MNNRVVQTTENVAEIDKCMAEKEMVRLRLLPQGIIFAPLDISPAIVLHTQHRAIASGHHRNMAAMKDVISFFTGSPADSLEVIRRRGADYVAICPDMPEMHNYAKGSPDGLWGQISRGVTPPWLVPIKIQGAQTFKVWRVVK
ncbi:hypothetical protein G7077_06020 [Sphingomonas piscis]|uniref:Uncharacterized protein n=1 Tax=Sphingomonas piscis TaxID=2714943 RepID=A0A6G7YP58_9SPHN|nr:hypothetical protein [Sphingomonas piscis]QIK78521.1 hypothetical protein G7077_06020 [Sphingomonas piscis]